MFIFETDKKTKITLFLIGGEYHESITTYIRVSVTMVDYKLPMLTTKNNSNNIGITWWNVSDRHDNKSYICGYTFESNSI